MTGARPDTWMPFYVGDYLRDTGHLSPAEHGAYMLLICHYWVSGGPIPDDDNRLRRVCRMTSREWDVSRETLAAFFVIADGFWQHKRVDSELVKALGITEARSKAGSTGAAKRWQGHGKRIATPSQNDAPSQPQSQKKEPDATASGRASGSAPPLPVVLEELPIPAFLDRRKPQLDMATWDFDDEARRICLDEQHDPERIAACIRDWAANAPKSKRTKCDPHAFVRNWCRKETDRRGGRAVGHGDGPPTGQRADGFVAAVVRDLARTSSGR